MVEGIGLTSGEEHQRQVMVGCPLEGRLLDNPYSVIVQACFFAQKSSGFQFLPKHVRFYSKAVFFFI